jgi:hypothetical protein
MAAEKQILSEKTNILLQQSQDGRTYLGHELVHFDSKLSSKMWMYLGV